MTLKRVELWAAKDGVEKRLGRVDTRGITPNPEPPAYTSHFVGDPGEGEYVIGWALGPNGNSTLTQADDNAGWPGDPALSVVHDYSGNASGIDAARIDAAHARGFIASQSFKMSTYTPAQIAAGTADGAIATLAAACIARAPKRIWLCYYHEPEDNFTTSATQASYRAAFRRIVTRCRTAGVTNVAWYPIFMNPFTFQSASGRDWRNYHPDWTGTTWNDNLTMDLMGMDTYEPLPWAMTGEHWYVRNANKHTFEGLWTNAKAKIELPGYPQWDYVIPEFGMSNAFNNQSAVNWESWCHAADVFARENRIKAFIYWDNSDDLGRWSFAKRSGWSATIPNPDANGTKKLGWDYLVENAVVMDAQP